MLPLDDVERMWTLDILKLVFESSVIVDFIGWFCGNADGK